MARIGVDYPTVKQAAIKLLSQGINPSVQKIRDVLGTGSNTTIAEHLNQWREEHSQKTVHHLPATMPRELISAVEVLWQAAMEQSENQLAAHKMELDSQQEKLKQEQLQNQKYFEQIQQQLSQSTNQLADKTTEHQTLQTNFAVINNQLELKNQQLDDIQKQFESRLQRAHLEKDDLADKNQQLIQEIKSLQEKFNDQVKTHQLKLQEIHARHEQSENRWLMLIDQERQETKEINKKLDHLRQEKDATIEKIKFELSQAKERSNELSIKLSLSRTTINELKDQLTKIGEKYHAENELTIQLKNQVISLSKNKINKKKTLQSV